MHPLLEVKSLSIAYGERMVLHDIHFTLEKGEGLSIVGESGSGKSTLIQAVLGLLPPKARVTSGSILFCGEELIGLPTGAWQKLRGAEIAMLFQNAIASFSPLRTVGTALYEMVAAHTTWSKEEMLERIRHLLPQLSLEPSVLSAYPHTLSGGMGQRVGILAAILLSPRLLLADEPTASLDTVTQAKVVELLAELKRVYQTGFLLVTHHMGVAWQLADKLLVLREGRVVDYGKKEDVFRHPSAYTRELIDAVHIGTLESERI